MTLFYIFQSPASLSVVAKTEAETQIKNDEKTSVIYGFNPPLQVYQPQVYGFYQEPLMHALISPQNYGLQGQLQGVVPPQNYGLHCQEQFVASQLYRHQPQQVYQPCVYFGKHEAKSKLDCEAVGKQEAEAELDFEAEAEAVGKQEAEAELDFEAEPVADSQYCASAYTAGYSFGAYDGYYNIEGYLDYS